VDLPLETSTAPAGAHGTVITLSELDQSKQFPLADTLKRLLVREYSREQDFAVLVNGEPLGVSDLGGPSRAVEWQHPEVGPVIVRWTLADKPLPRNEAGFVFRIGGKVVGRATFCG